MTTEPAPRIKVTYATLRADNEELHSQFEAALVEAKSSIGGYHRNYVAGAWRDGEGTFEVRSPIDSDLLVGTFASGTVAAGSSVSRTRCPATARTVLLRCWAASSIGISQARQRSYAAAPAG